MGVARRVARSLVVVIVLVGLLVASGCSHVVDPSGGPDSAGSYPAPTWDARFAQLDGRVLMLTPRGRTIAIEELVGGRVRPFGTHHAGGVIMRTELAPFRDGIWLASSVCPGRVRTGEDVEACPDDSMVELALLSADGSVRTVARTPDRSTRGDAVRLSVGPFAYRDTVVVQVFDTGGVGERPERRLVLDGDRLRPLTGDDGFGVVCATATDLFRVRPTPSAGRLYDVGLAIERWSGRGWVDAGLTVDESKVLVIELACTRTEAVVLLKRTGGADVVTIRGAEAPTSRPDLAFDDPTSVAGNRGDPTIPTFWSSGDSGPRVGKGRVTRIGPTGLVDVVAWPDPDGRGHGRPNFVVADPSGGVIVGTERNGKLRVRYDA